MFFWLLRSSSIGQNFDTGGRNLVEISTKLRPPQCRNFDQNSTKLRPNFDTPSVEVWSKVALYINGLHSKYDKNVYQTATPNSDQTPTKLRHPKCRSLVKIPTKLRHPIVQNVLLLVEKHF